MVSSANPRHRIVTDSIHGDIKLSKDEWCVVNTATFQRLRSLKQLGMGHLVYPNATHTRFAHSLGVFHIMCRVLDCLNHTELDDDKSSELRLAALLHDVGHYPYSHLMERVDWVTLTEEEVEATSSVKSISAECPEYPDHETLGRHILTNQADICEAIGGKDRAEKIGVLFSRQEAADQQLSKLIHSSLDMDRMDYLMRDARAAGVPFGEIDINYLLNSIRISPNGMLGVDVKALAAAEHFLLARAFMHRSVYYHKTTFGFEEACRQLLRRIRDSGRYKDDLPADGDKVRDICGSTKLRGFIDNFVDRIIFKAAEDNEDHLIKLLAEKLIARQPPKLLVELSGLEAKGDDYTAAAFFRLQCRNKLQELADHYKLGIGQFLLCGPKPIKFEQRGSLLTKVEAKDLESDEREELIMVFPRGENEPKSIVDMNGTTIKSLSNHVFAIQRLYFVDHGMDKKEFMQMKKTVQSWTET